MKEGDIYMDSQYHNPNDFWRQRMEPWEYDDIEEGFKRFIRWLGLAAAVLLIVLALMGCRSKKISIREDKDVSDSVQIEYREKIVKVPVTVYVEVPVEKKAQMDRDSSHLETSFAVSDARMVWIDGVLFLRHTLENKSQKIAKSDSVPVTEKEKVVWKTRRVTYNKTEIREKQLAWWQKGLMWSGAIGYLVTGIILLIMAVRHKK